MRNVSEQARVYKDELYVRGIGGVVTLNDLKDKQSLQDILGNGGGGDYPVEVKLPDSEYVTDFSAEFDKWYNVVNAGVVVVRLPEFPTDGKVRSFCVTLVNAGRAESIYFIPASENDYIIEQADVDYFDGNFHELNFVCVPTTVLESEEPMTVNIWFVTSTKFNDQPTFPPHGGSNH